MGETKERNKGGKLGLSRPGKLEIKKTIETGQVRQSFSHGRSKMVTVEVRKKRTYAPDAGGRMTEVTAEAMLAAEQAQPSPAVLDDAQPPPSLGPSLTIGEKAARARALEDAMRAFEPAPAGLVQPAPEQAPPVPGAEAPAADDAERAAKEEARRQAAEEERRREDQAKAAAAAAMAKLEAVEGEDEFESKGRGRRAPGRDTRRLPMPRRGERRRSGKLTIAEALGEDEERTRSLASIKRAREKERQKAQQLLTEGQKVIRDVVIPEAITVQELANRMAERSADVVKALMNMDAMVTINQIIDADTAELVVTGFGHNVKRVSDADVEIGLKGKADDPEAFLKPRFPVVTVMGHVDHGKTSLLDALRQTDVALHEAGGITQHIGAYQVTTKSGAKITFIDTPGHEAFTEMRARGARVTDIVVLCVAADDGIMPQTVEAIHHAKAANVPIIIAINKIDKHDADPARVRTDLLQHDLVVEEMGGEVLAVEVSAKEKINLDKLEEAILLQSEILDLMANPTRPAEGVIVESKVEQGRGTVATVLVQRGTLKVGDIFIAGSEWGRVRALMDANGGTVTEAGPSTPVEVLGLNGTPAAGDDVSVVENEARAREVTAFRQRRDRDAKATAGARGTLEQMFEKIKEGGGIEVLPVVVKADVHGSAEAIVSALDILATEEVKVHVLHSGVGAVNESDVTLAKASNAVVIGFNVRANPQAREMARQAGIEIRYYSIIYDLTEDLKKALSGMLAPKLNEKILGYAEIREVFSISKVGKIAGCMVTEGQVRRGGKVRLLRDEVVIHEGELGQLKRFKDDVREVKEGTECGIALANYQDIKAGDKIECFEIEEVARQL